MKAFNYGVSVYDCGLSETFNIDYLLRDTCVKEGCQASVSSAAYSRQAIPQLLWHIPWLQMKCSSTPKWEHYRRWVQGVEMREAGDEVTGNKQRQRFTRMVV